MKPYKTTETVTIYHGETLEGLHSVQSANEVDRVFQSHHELTPQEVIRNLIDNGVWEATLATRRDTIYATLTRKVKQGKLIRTDLGTYKKAK